ncbi:unknown [Firmicutes bacterium CAG:791]|nr:unknown [Firmicutes bacterium CAG:791]
MRLKKSHPADAAVWTPPASRSFSAFFIVMRQTTVTILYVKWTTASVGHFQPNVEVLLSRGPYSRFRSKKKDLHPLPSGTRAEAPKVPYFRGFPAPLPPYTERDKTAPTCIETPKLLSFSSVCGNISNNSSVCENISISCRLCSTSANWNSPMIWRMTIGCHYHRNSNL